MRMRISTVLFSFCTIMLLTAASWFGGGVTSAAAAAWGAITGTLTDQSDLSTALDGKVNDTGNETIAGTKTFSSTIVGSINGNAATATALAANPAACSAGDFVTDIDANGTLTCATPSVTGGVNDPGTVTAGQFLRWADTTGTAVETSSILAQSGSTKLVLTQGTQASSGAGFAHTVTVPNTSGNWFPYSLDITTTAGTNPGAIWGHRINIDAGTTNSGQVVGYTAIVSTTGTGNNYLGLNGNAGFATEVTGTHSTGLNLGLKAFVGNANRNVGVAGVTAGVAGSNAINVGVIGGARAVAAHSEVGGYFYKISSDSGTQYPSVDAALVCSNVDTSDPIAIFQDNTTEVMSIQDGGEVKIAKALTTTSKAVDLTADDQSVTVNDSSFVLLTSDDATAANRTIVLGNGASDGQHLCLGWNEDTATGAGELPDNTGNNVRLSAAWTPSQFSTLCLRWVNADSNWWEVSRSTN